jgi:hypothetical protein
MVIAFANNQVMVSPDTVTNTIYTDPVPLNGNDRATAHLFVEYIFNSTAPGVKYQRQVSNDGVNWVDVASLVDFTAPVTTVPRAVVASVNGAFLRFKLTFLGDGGVGAVNFDLHVMLDHV